MMPDSEEQKKLMQDRLEQFRARLETLTDSDFDAIMTKLGLSTDRTFPNQIDTSIVYTAPKGSQNMSGKKDTEIVVRWSAVVRHENKSQTFRELIDDSILFGQNHSHPRTRYTKIMNTVTKFEKQSYGLIWSYHQSLSSTPSTYVPKVQTQKHRTVSANLEHSSAVLSAKRRIPTA
jgi:hypothetical protein